MEGGGGLSNGTNLTLQIREKAFSEPLSTNEYRCRTSVGAGWFASLQKVEGKTLNAFFLTKVFFQGQQLDWSHHKYLMTSHECFFLVCTVCHAEVAFYKSIELKRSMLLIKIFSRGDSDLFHCGGCLSWYPLYFNLISAQSLYFFKLVFDPLISAKGIFKFHLNLLQNNFKMAGSQFLPAIFNPGVMKNIQMVLELKLGPLVMPSLLSKRTT